MAQCPECGKEFVDDTQFVDEETLCAECTATALNQILGFEDQD